MRETMFVCDSAAELQESKQFALGKDLKKIEKKVLIFQHFWYVFFVPCSDSF